MNQNSNVTYNSIYRSYLQETPKDMVGTVKSVDNFLDKMFKLGYSANSRRLYYYALKTLLQNQGYDVTIKQIPKIEEASIERHMFEEDEIQVLIKKAKEMGGIYTKSMVISTTYGVRRVELANLTLNDFNPKKKTLFIRTAKGGRPKVHLVPTEIFKYIDNDTKMLSIPSMTRIFKRIATEAGIHIKGCGWHSVRRALVSGLLYGGLPNDKVLNFMRWKSGTMLDIYHIKNPMEDIPIFEKHPFLAYWR